MSRARARFSLPEATGHVPLRIAALRMGMSETAFREKLPELVADGFPAPHRITGTFCLEAIDAYRLGPHARLLGLTAGPAALDARSVDIKARIAGLGNRG